MGAARTEAFELHSSEDVMRMRHAVRIRAKEMGFSLLDQTKLVTAASELGRNTVDYGGGGAVRMETVANGDREGIRLVFEDNGPGIPDIEMAMRDGFTSGSGLGLGLGGAKRLVNEFEIDSRPGEGTRVTVTRWK